MGPPAAVRSGCPLQRSTSEPCLVWGQKPGSASLDPRRDGESEEQRRGLRRASYHAGHGPAPCTRPPNSPPPRLDRPSPRPGGGGPSAPFQPAGPQRLPPLPNTAAKTSKIHDSVPQKMLRSHILSPSLDSPLRELRLPPPRVRVPTWQPGLGSRSRPQPGVRLGVGAGRHPSLPGLATLPLEATGGQGPFGCSATRTGERECAGPCAPPLYG